MTSIPVSSIVNVSIAVGATFPSRAGFGTLNVVTAETGVIGISERIRYYSTPDEVASDWDSSTEVVKAANSYFGQNPRPTDFAVSLRVDTDTPAELLCGTIADQTALLALLAAISDASFVISIDGTPANIVAMDFTSATTLSAVAAVIQSTLQAIATGGFVGSTCTIIDSKFVIKSGVSGAASTISFLTLTDPLVGTDISSLILGRQGQATNANGIDAETIVQALDAINNVNDDWYGLLFTNEVRDLVQVNGTDAVQEAAAWCLARVKVFFNTVNDLNNRDANAITDIGYILTQQGQRRSISTSHSQIDEYPSASAAGRAFTTNFNQEDSTITLKFKQLPGITVQQVKTDEKKAMDAKRTNAYIRVGSFDMYAEGVMHDGSFFDEVHGLDWLTNAIQNNVFGYMATRTTKVPNTDKGTNSVEQQVDRALAEGVLNGLLAPGTTVDGEFLPKGYKITRQPIANSSQSDKEARQYDGITFVCIGAGALHGIQISGNFER